MDHGNGDNKEEEEVVDMMTKTIDKVVDFWRLSLAMFQNVFLKSGNLAGSQNGNAGKVKSRKRKVVAESG